jgi:hypothetical protein
MSLHSSISIYPSAHLLADELGHWPSWEEYMASLPSNFRLYPATSRGGHVPRGLIDDSLPEYYYALGPLSYEDEEDGWVEVRSKNYGRFQYGKNSARGKAMAAAASAKIAKATKRAAEQQAFMAAQVTRPHFHQADTVQFVE